MLWLPPLCYRNLQTNLAATPSANIGAATVTGAAVAHTKGATWTELIASTTYETEFLIVAPANTSALTTRTDALLDIGIGGAALEQVLIPNILAGWSAGGGQARMFAVPLYIPKGSRISGRVQGLQASKVVGVGLWLFGGSRQPGMPTFTRVDDIGTSTAASTGTSITSGNTGAEGAWTSVGSATTRPYKALYFMPQGTLANTTMTTLNYHFEVGYSSTTIAEFVVATNSNENTHTPMPSMPIYHPIPTGTQLQVRGEAQGTAQAVDVALYGLY